MDAAAADAAHIGGSNLFGNSWQHRLPATNWPISLNRIFLHGWINLKVKNLDLKAKNLGE
jgi:hypothetical protein